MSVRCPILIGREEPAALIAGAVTRLAGPRRGGALVVTGEAGVGKSRLAGHMSAVAARAGVLAVTGRALPAGIGGPLGPVAEIVMAVTRDRPAPSDPDLVPYTAVLATVVPQWREPGRSAPAEPVLVTAEAVLRVLQWATDAGSRYPVFSALVKRLVARGVTAREAEVLDLLGERLSNREIAQRLFLSPRTVEKHVAALLVKLGAADRGGPRRPRPARWRPALNP